MEFLIILILVAIAAYYFLRKQKSQQRDDTESHTGPADATFVCDECGERECICREEKKE